LDVDLAAETGCFNGLSGMLAEITGVWSVREISEMSGHPNAPWQRLCVWRSGGWVSYFRKM
jgi:hypothetical protein